MPEMTIDELNVKLTGDVSGIRNDLNKVKNDFKDFQKNAKDNVSKVGDLFKSLQNTIRRCAIGQMIYKEVVSNVDSAISRLDTLNNYAKTMGNLGISSEDSQASLSRLSDALVGLPTTMDAAALAVQRFTSANGNIKASTEMFLALNNAVLAGGAPTEAQASAIEQLSQAYSKGKPDMMEWRTAMQAMPAQLKQVAISMGYVNADQLGEALRNGTISMNEFMVELTKLNKNGVAGFASFEEQARNSTGGVQTSMINVKTAITRGLADIMNAIGQSNIAAFFNGIASAINRVVPYVVAFTKVVVTAVGAIAGLFGKTVNSQVANTAKSISSVGSSAASTSKNIDGTTKSAKGLSKAMKSLAGFDEMNVLTDNSNSGGGSSGSGDSVAAGLGDLSGIDLSAFDSLNEKSSAADEIYQRMITSLSKVKEFLMTIWDSAPVQAYIGAVSASWKWQYDYIVTVISDIWNNMNTTWGNIENNISQTLTNIADFWTQYWSDIQLGIETWGQPIIDGVSQVFNAIWKDAIDPVCQFISTLWMDLTGSLVTLWEKHGNPLVNNIGEFVTKTIALFQSLWDNIIAPIIAPFLETLSNLWNDHLKTMVEEVGDFIGALVNGALEIYNKFIVPIVRWLLDKLAPSITTIAGIISATVGAVAGTISNVVTTITGILKGIINFVTGVFTGNWKKAWQGVGDIFTAIFNGLKNAFKIPINWIIDGINSFISGINRIKIPSWVPVVGGKGFSIGKIPRLAQGGIIDRATLAVVGESGREAVLPLDRNTEWMNEFFNRMPKGDSPQTIVVQIGNETVAKKVVDWIKDSQFTTDEEVFVL